MQSIYPDAGRFWRGNLHTHSSQSDGALPPEEVCRRYQAMGYDFLCLSDHLVGLWGYPIVDTTGMRRNDFTTLLGAELHTGRMENGAIWHMLAVGLPADFARPDQPDFNPDHPGESAAALAARARAAGAFVSLVHPHWSGLQLAEALAIDAAHAVEVYNHGSAVEVDRGDGLHIWDQMLTAGRRINGIACDDAHFHEADAFGGWVMVKAPALDPDALLEALKAGHHYASQGPLIHDIRSDGRFVEVDCSPASRVIVQGAADEARRAAGAAMTTARIRISDMGPGLKRVTVIDAAGKRAWSNPLP